MKRFFAALAIALCVVTIAFAVEPPGDTSVKKIKITKDLPTEVQAAAALPGQFQFLANQLSMIHEDAKFAMDAEEGVLYVSAPVAADIVFDQSSDCAVNTQYNLTTPLAERREVANRYKTVLVAWTKSRHGVPGVPIQFSWTPETIDVTLNGKQLEVFRTALAHPPVAGRVAFNE